MAVEGEVVVGATVPLSYGQWFLDRRDLGVSGGEGPLK